jgi:uncharacterized membrane protein
MRTMIEPRSQATFLALILAQIAHSTEECVFRLYEVFAPARFASTLLGSDPATGFALLNTALCAFGLWCYAARVRTNDATARYWMWPWIVIELSNGVVHSVMAVVRGGYFPGVATAPVLFALAAFLTLQLRGHRNPPG